ncbi:MAG: SOS response-associated peptidase [Panacagrimonas sp.]
MCSNYKPVTRIDHLVSFFGVTRDFTQPPPEFDAEIWPLRLAPFIRLALDGSGQRHVEAGQFGLMPHFAKETAYGRKTYNSRSETVHKLPSFRDAWKRGQRCIIPAECIYEPCYESGASVRWCIEQAGGVPMGIAGIWSEHPTMTRKDGSPLLSFAMLTVNADAHPVFQRMHAPQDEKRMVVILHPDDYDRWLSCPVEEAPIFFRQWMGPLNVYPKPLPPRKPRAKKQGDIGI